MKKITYYCDRCGQHIPGEPAHPADGIDLCAECASEFLDLLQEFIQAGPRKEPEPAPEPKPEKNPARKRIELDLGKIGALREAGWSCQKIAEEIGCSAATIGNHLNEAMEFLRKRREKQGLERREEE